LLPVHYFIAEFVNIIRPYRSTTYVDATYCYRPSSIVCRSVCLSVTVVSLITYIGSLFTIQVKLFENFDESFLLEIWKFYAKIFIRYENTDFLLFWARCISQCNCKWTRFITRRRHTRSECGWSIIRRCCRNVRRSVVCPISRSSAERSSSADGYFECPLTRCVDVWPPTAKGKGRWEQQPNLWSLF